MAASDYPKNGLLRLGRELSRFSLVGADGLLGDVTDAYVDDAWVVRYLAVAGSGAVGRRPALVTPLAIGSLDREAGSVAVELTCDQLARSPAPEPGRVPSRQFEERYYAYFGWPGYWLTAPAGSGVLRAAGDILGCRVMARGEPLGRVDDLLLDPRYWTVRFLEAAASDDGGAPSALVRTGWVEGVDTGTGRVTVALGREALDLSRPVAAAPARHLHHGRNH